MAVQAGNVGQSVSVAAGRLQAAAVRRLVFVSGAPGAGKSTVAGPLASGLGLPLLCKDVIKETLFDQLGRVADDERLSSRKLGGAAMELIWRVAESCPGVVLEANFRPHSSYERERLLALSPRPVEVHCRVPLEVAAERYTRRGASASHHPVHIARTATAEALLEYRDPLGIGPLIEVDASQEVDIPRLTDEVVRALRP